MPQMQKKSLIGQSAVPCNCSKDTAAVGINLFDRNVPKFFIQFSSDFVNTYFPTTLSYTQHL